MIDEQKFKKLADDALNSLNRDLIAASDDYGFEVDFNAGALGVEFEDPPAKFVISPNAPVRQIWISALTTSFKLAWSDSAQLFVQEKTGENLNQVTSRILTEKLGKPIEV